MSDDQPRSPRKEINRNPRRNSSRLSSVTTAIHLLKTFTEEDQELGISEIAKRLDVAKSTVHRLAGALLEEGLLQQNPETGRYGLGVGLFSLGSLVRARLDVTIESKHVLSALREQIKENVRLAVLERDSVVFLHDFEGPQTLRLRSATGQLRPAFCTAEGLCLISGLRQPQIDQFLAYPRFERAPNTTTDEDAFLARVRQVKRRGYAFEDEECDEGTRCVAAPIFNAEGRIVASVGVAGPRARIKKNQIPKIAPIVVEAASEISQRMGFIQRQPIYV
ncbi:MAG: IclR family transcriptional regulator [Alphaproteobacteria bacterium]|nr:IclR family transcriptional regulator [Alphaproteobacteria bacterium]NNF24884.1 IclR family transcriptional regulator [Paracoccaceae bacterium]